MEGRILVVDDQPLLAVKGLNTVWNLGRAFNRML